MKKRILMTGATGYIGRHVLRGLLKDGHCVTAIVRKKDGRLAERIDAGKGLPQAELEAVEGDITLENCGLDENHAGKFSGKFDVFLHCAGLTEFDAALAARLRRHNVMGVQNAFFLSSELKIPRFCHVSTAFVAGNAASDFSDRELDLGQSFKNPYEQSKFDAEIFLRKVAKSSMPVTIYRPSIVVGGKPLGEDGSAGTLYAYLKALHFLRECFEKDRRTSGRLAGKYNVTVHGRMWRIPLRVEADSKTRLNLIHISDVVNHIVSDMNGACAFSVQNLVSKDTFSIGDIKEQFCAVLGIEGIELEGAEAFSQKSKTGLEEKMDRMTRSFKPYCFQMPVFVSGARTETPVSLSAIAQDFVNELDLRKDRSGRNLGTLAMDCLGVFEPDRYLDRFADGDFGQSLLKRISFVRAKVQFRIHDNEMTRTLVFHEGAVRALSPQDDAKPDFIYELDAAVFKEIVSGRLDPREAFFKGLLKISGDQELALKFGNFFTEYFANIDNRILEEMAEQT